MYILIFYVYTHRKGLIFSADRSTERNTRPKFQPAQSQTPQAIGSKERSYISLQNKIESIQRRAVDLSEGGFYKRPNSDYMFR